MASGYFLQASCIALPSLLSLLTLLFVLAALCVSSSLAAAVAPLFETLDDLHNAPGTMRTLLSSEWYKYHITERHGGVQECMIGTQFGGDACVPVCL